jgi:hypothetical protein
MKGSKRYHIHGDETIERIEGRKGIRVNKVD